MEGGILRQSGKAVKGEGGSARSGGGVRARQAGGRRPNGARKPARSGLFITLEGGEGAGKSTQIHRLAKYLKERGRPVVVTREPGGSPGAEAVRHVLLSGAAELHGPEMEAILFNAARADHIDTVIRPAIAAGKAVICDRFYDSTRVYQGVEGKLDAVFVRRLEAIAVGETIPDLTLILDLDAKEGMRRAAARRNPDEAPDRFEKESVRQQELRRKAYLEIARNEPERCAVIDADGTAEAVFEEIRRAVDERLGDRLKPAARSRAGRAKPAGRGART